MNSTKMKVAATMVAVATAVGALSGCGSATSVSTLFDDAQLGKEARGCFDFFWEQAATTEKGYGLVRDRYPGSPNVASTASTGFALASIPIGVENGAISRKEGYERVERTLNTLENLDNFSGFFYHFIDMNSGERVTNCEVSVIDTGLLMCGVIAAGEYFGGDLKKKADELYARIDWNFYYDTVQNRFYMAYSPEKGYSGHWDVYAEQLLLYVLAAGAPNPEYRIGKEGYDGFRRLKGNYNDGETFIYSWFGSIFTYQYSHSFVDFRDIIDSDGINWFENSVVASESAYRFCKDNKDKYLSFDIGWGLSAGDSPTGYDGLLGAPPSGDGRFENKVTATIPPYGALGSLVFTPELSLEAIDNYSKYGQLWGEYGLISAFNIDQEWYAEDVIGIDKGITLLMMANYKDGFIWNQFMKNTNVKNGIKEIGFVEIS